jgi:hypothetical protein
MTPTQPLTVPEAEESYLKLLRLSWDMAWAIRDLETAFVEFDDFVFEYLEARCPDLV